MSDLIRKQLIQSRKVLKDKYNLLKQEKAFSQKQFKEQLQPLIEPIQKFISSAPLKTEIKHEPKTPSNISQYYKFMPNLTGSIIQPEFGETFIDDNPEEVTPEVPQEVFDSYLNKYNPLPRGYIEDLLNDNEGNFDHTFGVYFDPESKEWSFGDSVINFDGRDIIIQDLKYKGTPGLYELLFKKFPTGYRPEDVDNFIDIVKRTNAQYLGYNPEKGLSTSNAKKFIDIIKPRVTNLYSMSQDLQRSRSNSLPQSSLPRLQTKSPKISKLLDPKKSTSQNGTSTYEIPVTGKVVRVQCDPNILNVNYKNQSTKIEDLINGNILNKGDIMEFKFNHNQPSLSLYLEMVMQCPLEH
ncbi:unnamed protein product [Psylliodes chrysocephalus]|uniref:DUF8207 domain-containing protein n=1 Tax=Psylliodes chrysocephalus TaxID=3402493 RepID=A0A9P0D6C4_9CUCU|nr:unnamed protein product [Psylliodes chrysocephala]